MHNAGGLNHSLRQLLCIGAAMQSRIPHAALTPSSCRSTAHGKPYESPSELLLNPGQPQPEPPVGIQGGDHTTVQLELIPTQKACGWQPSQ